MFARVKPGREATGITPKNASPASNYAPMNALAIFK
jgi:hypothetical protein